MQSTSYQYLNFVSFISFSSWDVKRNFLDSYLSKFNIVELGSIVKEHKKEISKKDIIQDRIHIIEKLNFSGQLFLSPFERVYDYKGKVSLVPKNSIIFSKINAKHGCVYYNEDLTFGVSNEYPCFILSENINGKYLKLLFQTNNIKKILGGQTTGMAKTRTKVEDFLNIKIPLPSLTEQQRIVDRYHELMDLAQTQAQQAEQKKQEIESYLMEELGIEIKNPNIIQKGQGLNIVNFTELNRRDTEYFYKGEKQITSSKYELKEYGELFKSLQNGISGREFSNEGFVYLTVSDIKNNAIDTKNIRLMKKVRNNDIVKEGTLLITRKGTVGNSAVVQESNKYVCSSEIFIIQVNDYVNPEFLSIINGLDFAKQQYIEKYTGTIMPSMSQPALKSIKIPVPNTIDEQNTFIQKYKRLNDIIETLQTQSQENQARALAEFEQEIFS